MSNGLYCCMMSSFRNGPIAIEGNIGSGKSTLLQYIKSKDDAGVEVVLEQVETWRDYHGHNILGWLYSHPKISSLFPQLLIMTTNISDLYKACAAKDVVDVYYERSLEFSPAIFIKRLFYEERLTSLEKELCLLFNQFQQSLVRSGLIVYVRTSVSTCLTRINKRQRNEELNLSEQFLTAMETCIDGCFRVVFNDKGDPIFNEVVYYEEHDVYVVCLNGETPTEELYEALMKAVADFKVRKVSDVADIAERATQLRFGQSSKNMNSYTGIVNSLSSAPLSETMRQDFEKSKLNKMHRTESRRQETTNSLYGIQLWLLASNKDAKKE